VTSQPESSFVTLRDGINLRILTWSTVRQSPGVPLLLIHGLASNVRLWDGPARILANMGHAVTAVDLRGHGLSDKPDNGYAMSDVADDIADVLSSLEGYSDAGNKPLLIGQSWGGNIVVECAHRHAQKLRGVVAVDGGTIELATAFPEWDECARTLSPPALAGMKYERLRSYIRAAHPDWSDEAIDGQMFNMERLPDGTIRPWLTLDRHLTVLHGLWQHTPSQLWEQIEIPILFTPAAKEKDAHSESKRKQIAHAVATLRRGRAEWFEPADHDLHAQFPDRFASVVDDAINTGFFS
jgi:pimeloyl-ACP methyl ester carboxylesterase